MNIARRLATRLPLRLGVRLVILIGACVFVVFTAELAFRIAGMGSDQFLRPDPVLGVRFIASKDGVNQAACFQVDVSINSHGWRSREVAVAKPEGVYRVLVLGDSYMAGLQVEDDETLSAVLDRQLNRESLARRVEVINFGVPSFGTDQEYLSLREQGLRFEPDLVLLAFFAQNDVRNNHAVLELEGTTYPKPFFDVENGRLVELPFSDSTPAMVALGRRLAASFRLYPWVRDSLLQIPMAHQFLYDTGIVGIVPHPEQSAPPREPVWRWPGRWRNQTEVYRQVYSDNLMHAWAITRRLIVETRDVATSRGAEFLLVGIADPIAVLPTSLLRGLDPGDLADMLDLDKPSAFLRAVARDSDIDFISLVPAFSDRIGDSETRLGQYYLSCDGHWTPAGAVLTIAYCAISISTAQPWPWLEVVHESGDRTLIGTILYFEHGARELPLDLLLGVALGGSVLFASPTPTRTTSAPHRARLGLLGAGVLAVVAVIIAGTLWTGGLEMLTDNLLQLHTRPGTPLTWGAHWRYHLLSRALLMLFSLGCAGTVVLATQGKTGVGDKAGLSVCGAALGLFALLTLVFAPDWDSFRNPMYLGHQAREVLTHILVTIPVSWGACLILAGRGFQIAHGDTSPVYWPVVAGVGSVLIGLFLVLGGLITSAASQGQTQDVVLLVFPHFFEHTFTYLLVSLVAAFVYESARTTGTNEGWR